MWNIWLNIYQTIWNTIWSKDIRIWFLAKFTLKLFPAIRYQVSFFFLGHFLFQPIFQALVMNISNRSRAFTTIEKWILSSRSIIPTNLTLNVIRWRWINNSTVNLNHLFFKFLIEWIKWSVMSHLFLWSDIMFISTVSMIIRFFNFVFFSDFFWD